MRTVSRVLPVVVFLAAALAAVLASQPWDDEAAEVGAEIEDGVVKHRLCDTVVEAPPLPKFISQSRNIVAVSRYIGYEMRGEAGKETVGLYPELHIRLIPPRTPADGVSTNVWIDPFDSAVGATEGLLPTKLQAVLDTVRHEPLDRSKAPWPYTDDRRPTKRMGYGLFRVLVPDPASGIVVSLTRGMGMDGSAYHALEVANCQSVMFVTMELSSGAAQTGPVADTRFVQPEDKAAFKEFLRGVSPGPKLLPLY